MDIIRKPSQLPDLGINAGTTYKTAVHYTSYWKHRLIDTWSSISQNLISIVCQWRKRLCACKKVEAKRHNFERLLNQNVFSRATTLHTRLFSEPPTVYCGKHVTLHIISITVVVKEFN